MDKMKTEKKEGTLKRKIQYQHGSYTISLPKDLLIGLKLGKGDTMNFETLEDGILLKKENAYVGQTYTIGYQTKSIKTFIDLLEENKIRSVIDVRSNAFSWKKDFMAEKLNITLQESGIGYVNIPSLGAPRVMREDIKVNKKPEIFFANYRKWLELHNSAFELLVSAVNTKTSAIMCLEDNPMECHRSIISERLEKIGYKVVHI